MASTRLLGRTTGVLLLLHLVCGLMLPYILLQPALAAPGYLENAAAHAARVRTAVLLLFGSGALTVAVALGAWPLLRRHGERLAGLLVLLSAVNLALHAVENGALLSMLSLSQDFTARLGIDDAASGQLGAVVASVRWWAHVTQLLVVGSWILTLFVILWRSRLVPRALAALGLVATLLQLAGVPLRALLGMPVLTSMAMPLAPVYLAVAVLLMFRGFVERE